jgi:LysM repeat protein
MTIGPDQPNSKGLPNLPKSSETDSKAVKSAPLALKHTVKPSENLIQIARKYLLKVEELTKANGLTEHSLIYPGLELLIPTKTEALDNSVQRAEEHLVQPNESLYSISQRYSLSVARLQQLNDLGDNAMLFPGTRLNLIEKIPDSKPSAAIKLEKRAPTTCLVHGYHRVMFGDRINRIAAFHGVSTQSLLSANNLTWNAVIHEGQKLIVPISHGPNNCPNLVQLEPAAKHTAITYYQQAKELNQGDFCVVVALCLEMQRSGLLPEYGALNAGKELFRILSIVPGIENMNVKQALSSSGFETYAAGSALWEPSAWAWLAEVKV